jgi:hypothetical protein
MFMQGVLPLPAALRVAQDLAKVVVHFGFKYVFCSLNWLCGIKLLLECFPNQKTLPPPSTV